MSPEDQEAINAAISESIRRRRGYADFFGWPPDRDLEEKGVAGLLAESLKAEGALFFSTIAIRGRGNDPPDLEALDKDGNRIAIEVTELVDGDAIRASKNGSRRGLAAWTRARFLSTLGDLLSAKNARFPDLKGAPYPGGYVVVVFTDETFLRRPTVEAYLRGHAFSGLADIDRAFLLLSYDPDPAFQRCPCFELQLS
jgi:hypothetical protein